MRFCVRASSVRFAGATLPVWLCALLALGVLPGCQKQDEISRYTVKKMPQVEKPARDGKSQRPTRPAGHGAKASERMLGAITSQGRTVWIFKLEGPKETVADQMPKFLSLIQSLKFGEEDTSPPKWTLPEDWTEREEDDPRGLKFKTLVVKTDGEELVLGDGRRTQEATATYLPPCDPTKILCIHLNYESRRIEFRSPELSGGIAFGNVGYVAADTDADDLRDERPQRRDPHPARGRDLHARALGERR